MFFFSTLHSIEGRLTHVFGNINRRLNREIFHWLTSIMHTVNHINSDINLFLLLQSLTDPFEITTMNTIALLGPHYKALGVAKLTWSRLFIINKCVNNLTTSHLTSSDDYGPTIRMKLNCVDKMFMTFPPSLFFTVYGHNTYHCMVDVFRNIAWTPYL